MLSFEPRVGKAQTGQTSGGFSVIIPYYYYSCLFPFFNLACSECKKHSVVAFPKEDPFSVLVPAGNEINKVCYFIKCSGTLL